jgi:Leucine-rich repeat (LRR) protein
LKKYFATSRYLDLNNFPVIKREMFASIPSVRDLYLQQCGIAQIEKRAFKDLQSLNGLHLSHNNILELFPNAFRDLLMKDLDLSFCGIQNIRKGAFRTRITNGLYLSHNNITVVNGKDFKELEKVRYIDLSYSNIAEIKGSPFLELDSLEQLHLQYNNLEDEDITASTLNSSGNLWDLDLTGNKLQSIPDLNGKYFPYLQKLNVGGNMISLITNTQLRNMTSLSVLILRENPIELIDNEAFIECWKITDLNLDFTRVKNLPNMSSMGKLTDLHIVHSKLVEFPEDICTTNPRLIIIEATANNLQTFTNFSNCRNLFSLALDHNSIPNIPQGVLNGLTKLDILKLHENEIGCIASGVFNDLRILKSLTLYHNQIEHLPAGIFSKLTALRKLNLGFNRILSLPDGLFSNNTLLTNLWLNDNSIHQVHVTAFGLMPYLEVLNMSSNFFCSLEFPDAGFPSLRILSLELLWCLHNVPNPHKMPNAQEVFYTYAYHCCLWEDTLNSDVYKNDTILPTTIPPEATGAVTLPPEVITVLPDPFEKDCTSEGASPDRQSIILEIAKLYNLTIIWGPDCGFTVEGPINIGLTADDIANLQNGQPTNFLDNGVIVVGTETEGFFIGVNDLRSHYVPPPKYPQFKKITCYPRPNPLTPCDNLLDPWPIRIAIWAVWVLTLLGNITILFIMIAAHQRMDVSQSFICVLAFSNTLLGIYLAFIAMVDIRTLGDRSFYQSALEWQKGSGCQTAGFLAIFSSQLSVYILVVLTIERLHHIVTSTISLRQKQSKKLHHAVIIIIIGIVYAAILAVLPLKGMDVNAYDEVAICLPFVTHTSADRGYILSILTLNMLGILIVILAFLLVIFCLFRPSLPRKQRWDILKSTTKLSLLMVTTFLCWFPIGVVGYTSILEEPIIDAGQAKYFIVYVFPINALFSPIIYALITRSFRRNIWWILTCCPNAKNKNKSPQTFRLVQRQATSTPTSLMSSDIPHGHSPRSITGEELRVLRQSRRSNSYSVQFNPNVSKQPLCSTPPTPGSIARMGRRASLPATFESNVSCYHLNNREDTAENDPALPFRFAPGLLRQLDSSLPNLPEENEEQEMSCDNAEHISLPQATQINPSTVQERDEINMVEPQSTKCKESFEAPGQSSRTPAKSSIQDSCTRSNDTPKPCIPQQRSNSCSFFDSHNTHYVEEEYGSLNSSERPQSFDPQYRSIRSEKSLFDYIKLQDTSVTVSSCKRLQIVNPRFSTLSPTQGSETDV